ncbi:MAG: hypothetical protein JWM83_2405 [Candidatus Angelobacter sp.]|nr:hypothetical protein [Candidatus Angelobacter sp.]
MRQHSVQSIVRRVEKKMTAKMEPTRILDQGHTLQSGNMKQTRVSFPIDPPFAIAGQPEDYGTHGIHLAANGNQVTAIIATVEHAQPDFAQAVVLARDRIAPFVALLQFIGGRILKLGTPETKAVNYSGTYVSRSCQIPWESLGSAGNAHPFLPPTTLVSKLAKEPELSAQLAWFNAGECAQFSVERIRNYFEVLELEERRSAYKPPDECRCLRHAVSHPRLNDRTVVSYLQDNISSAFIDPNKDTHLRFLEGKVDLLRSEARCVIDRQLRT